MAESGFGPVILCSQVHTDRQKPTEGFLPFPKQALAFTGLQCKSLENTVGKGELLGTSNFSFFSTVFSTYLENVLPL